MEQEATENNEQGEGGYYSNPDHLIQRCKDAEKTFDKRYWTAAAEAWSEYDLGEHSGKNEATEAGTGQKIKMAKHFPIFWSSIKTLLPAYYSKTPIPIAPIRYGITDPDARTGSRLLERLGIYSLEVTPFDEVIEDAALEYILSDVVTTRVMLEGDKKSRQIQISKNEEAEDEYYMQDGNPYQGQMVGQNEETGEYYGEEEYWEGLKCYPMALSYDDVTWTCEASCEAEIDEMRYRFCYPEEEAYEMFPEIDREELKTAMKAYGRKEDEKYAEKKKDADAKKMLYLHGWEVWCRKDKTIRFISHDYKGKYLAEKPDTYRLRNFFPSPCPIVGTKQRKTLFGRPGYCYVKPLIEQMHEVAQRVYNVSQSIRRRFVVDKEFESDLHPLISDADESEYIFIKKLMNIVEKGGIQNVIQALPVDDLSRSLVELSSLFEKFKQEFYEIYGVPDVVRGASDPLETAKAQEIKSFSATNRFRQQMNKIAMLARDTLELLVDLKLGAYPPEQILRVCGAQYLEPEDQRRLPNAYALITNDEDRIVRLDFETDSTSYINEQIEQANLNVAIQTVTQGIAALNGLSPTQIAVGFKTIQASLSRLRLGKEFMDDIDQLMNQMMEELKNPPPPQPDVEMLKVQQKGQELQMKAAQQAQESQIKAMMEGQKIQQKEREMMAKMETDRYAMFQKDQQIQLEAQKMQIDNWSTQMERYFDSVRLKLEQVSTAVSAQVETALVKIKDFEVRVGAAEAAAEEIRLARDSELAIISSAKDIIESNKQEKEAKVAAPAQPPINVTFQMPNKKEILGMKHDDKTGMSSVVYADPEKE